MTSSNKPYSISLLICGYKVLSILELTKLGSDSCIFHCPENAGRYNQAFEMNLLQLS